MVRISTRRIVTAVVCLGVFALLPATPQAQRSSTFVIEFERTGPPEINPDGTIKPNTGGLLNPCTQELVDVTGSSTITIVDGVYPNGDRKISVSVSTKGVGIGQLSGALYPFRESQSFNVRSAPSPSLLFESTFSDKLAMKGLRSVDNWIMRAFFRIRIDEAGNIITDLQRITDGDLCRG